MSSVTPAENSSAKPVSLTDDADDRFRLFMDHMPGIAWIKDAAGRYVFVNRACEQRSGISLADWRGKTDFDLWPADIAQRFRENDVAVLNSGQPHEFLEEAQNRDGGRSFWWCQKFLIRDPAGGMYVGGTGVDISARQHDEEVLREHEHFLQALLDSSTFVVLGMTPNYRVFEWNRAAEQIYGWTRAEALGRNYINHFLPEEIRSAVMEEIRQLLNGRPTVAYPNKVLHRNGTCRTLLWNACRLFDARGAVRGLIAVGQDITDRIETEEALRENQDRLEFALDASHAGTWSWDVAANRCVWDHRNAEQYGLDPQQPVSFGAWMNQIDPQDRPRLAARIQEMLQTPGDDIWNVEFRTIPLSNGQRWMAGLGRVERNADGQAIYFRGINLDITERKQVETAARQTEAEIQALVEAFPDLYFWLEADGTIVRYRGGMATYVTPEQFLHRRMQDVLPPEVGAQIEQCIENALQLGTIQNAEYSLTGPDGERRYDARLIRLSNSDKLLVAVRDVTARYQAEAESRKLQSQLQHAQKLESLGILAGGIAHDFNNILTSVLGFADLAAAELPEDSSAKGHLNRVLLSARRAAELTQQMLAYSGKGQFVVEAVNLTDLVKEITPLVQSSISKLAVVHFQLDSQLPRIQADASQMRQIIMNLIINASDALENEDGEITVSTHLRHCRSEELSQVYLHGTLPEGNYVALEVSDTGRGMDAKTRARIFDPFFTTKTTGRGLGLAVVLGIVRGHHGAIHVLSEPGRGSTFRILLPVPAKPLAASARTVEDSATGRLQGKILVVDDEELVRDLAAAMLTRAGLAVVTAADGRAALREFAMHSEEISAVLLDLSMPYMSGGETYRELRKLSEDVPVILTSGYNEQSTTEFADANLAGFLQKPYSYQELSQLITQVLSAK